jgi:hypothetical protein
MMLLSAKLAISMDALVNEVPSMKKLWYSLRHRDNQNQPSRQQPWCFDEKEGPGCQLITDRLYVRAATLPSAGKGRPAE